LQFDEHVSAALQAESQARRIYLLQQAAKKRGEHLELPPPTAGPALALILEPQQLESSDSLQQPSAAAEQSAVAVREQEAQPELLQHINFFAEHEAREAHPEVNNKSCTSCIRSCFFAMT
jgi:hypothetical protein